MPEEKKRLELIFDRLKSLYGFEELADLADRMGVARNTLYQARKRDSVPYKQIDTFCMQEGISLEWVFNGRGSAQLDDDPTTAMVVMLTTLIAEVEQPLPTDKLEKIMNIVKSRWPSITADEIRSLLSLAS